MVAVGSLLDDAFCRTTLVVDSVGFGKVAHYYSVPYAAVEKKYVYL